MNDDKLLSIQLIAIFVLTVLALRALNIPQGFWCYTTFC